MPKSKIAPLPFAVAAALLAVLAAARLSADDAVPLTPLPQTPGAAPDPLRGKIPAEPFTETTTVKGDVKADLTGVWLVVANALIAQDKFKTFPDLLRISKGDKGYQFHFLDVVFPDPMNQQLMQANFHTLTAWQPSPELLASLKSGWSKLPIMKEKGINDLYYQHIDYTLAAPDELAAMYPKRSEQLDKVLDGAAFCLQVEGEMHPRSLPADAKVLQLMQRTTVYCAKTVAKNLIKGDQTLGFLAAAPNAPLPLQFSGTFAMYRIE